MTMTEPPARPARRTSPNPPRTSLFLFRPLRQAAGLGPRQARHRLARPLAPLEARQGAARPCDRADPRRCCACPTGHRIGIVPASDTGAVEMALWTMLGAAAGDHARLGELRRRLGDRRRSSSSSSTRRSCSRADYGELPDLGAVDPASDVVFTWNGTTSGVRVPDGDWIADDREGLTIADATSAGVRAGPALGQDRCRHLLLAEGAGRRGRPRRADPRPARGRAAGKLHARPGRCPRSSGMTKGGKLIEGIFKGETINTPSMLAVEDYICALEWAELQGGLDALIARADANAAALDAWVAADAPGSSISPPIRRRAPTPASASNSPSGGAGLDEEAQRALVKKIDVAARGGRRGLRHRRLSRRAAGPPHLVRRHRRHRRHRGARPLARLGLSRGAAPDPSSGEGRSHRLHGSRLRRETRKNAQSADFRPDGSRRPPRSSAPTASRSTRGPASRRTS